MRLSDSTLAIIDNPAPGKSWGFLRPEVCYSRHVLLVGTMHGTECIDCDGLGLPDPPDSEDEEAVHEYCEKLSQYLEGGIVDPESVCESMAGYVCRMSAPGYMDCTSWEYCETEADVLAFLKREAEDITDDDTDPEEDDADACARALAKAYPQAPTLWDSDASAYDAAEHMGGGVYRLALVTRDDDDAEAGYVIATGDDTEESIAAAFGNTVSVRFK